MENLVEKHEQAISSAQFEPLSEAQKPGMGVLLENADIEAKKLISEGTLSGDIQTFTNILMPLVRRSQPALIANQLATVVPMSGPTGYIYSMTNRYIGDNVNGLVSPTAGGQIVVVEDASGINVGATIAAGAKSAVVVYKEGEKLLVKSVAGSFVAGDDLGSGNLVTATYSNEAAFTRVLKNYTGPVSTAAGEALGRDIKQVGLAVGRKMVEAKTRKLKAEYTMEMFQDLQAVHGVNALNELMALMSYEIQAEQDREIIDFVNGQATAVSDAVVSGYDGRWEIEKYRSLALKIESEAREIARLTRKGAANQMVISPKVAVMLKALGGFELAPVRNNIDSASIAQVAGTFEGKTVIIDNMATSEYVTMQYKGAGDSAVYYMPYVGATFAKTVNFDSAQPACHIMMRYGLDTNPLNPEYYIRSFGVNMGGTVLA